MVNLFKKAFIFGFLLSICISIIDAIINNTQYSSINYRVLGFLELLAFNLVFWVLVSLFICYVYSKFIRIKLKSAKNNQLFLSLIISLMLFLNILFIFNRRVFKLEWLSNSEIFNITLRAGFVDIKVILTNVLIILIGIICCYLIYKLFIRLKSYKNISIISFLILLFVTKNNHILAGDFNPLKLGSSILLILIFAILLIYLYKYFINKYKIKIKAFIIVIMLFIIIFAINFIANPNAEVNNNVYSKSPESKLIINQLIWAFDKDDDGFVKFIGSFDCNNKNKNINILVFDIPNDNIDQDCSGSDFKLESFKPEQRNTNKYDLKDYNIVFIIIDALRADHLSSYSYEKKTSPNIDSLANKGLMYTNLMASSTWTISSLPSIITSKYPSIHNVYELRKDKLKDGFTTIFEILKENGYQTSLFNPYHAQIVKGYESFAQGVDYYYDEFDIKNGEPYLKAELLNQEFYKWFNQNKSGKFFTLIHYGDIHYPYSPPKPYDNLYVKEKGKISLYSDALSKKDIDFAIARYDGAITYLDSQIKGLIEFLKEKNVYNKTIIIITSDHGEEFLEHGGVTHGRTLYTESLQSPLIIYAPNKLPSIKSNMLASNVDITPTLLDLLNINYKGDFDGSSLLNNIGNRYVYSELRNNQFDNNHIIFSIQNERYQYIYNVQNGQAELYDKEDDKGEHKNLIYKEPNIAKEMHRILFDWRSSQILESKEYVEW